MKFEYKETSDDLMKRIDIHNRFGGRDIDQWMLDLLDCQKGISILDIGCGAGKLCFSFYTYLAADCEITGVDVSTELLEKARLESKARNANIKFDVMDFNKPFAFEDNRFDLVTCSFAIYYAENIPFTISEMRRVLKPGGRLFTSGPMPENKKIFYEIIHKAVDKPIPPMPGSSRYGSEILDEIKKQFSSVKVDFFENPLTFETADPFVDYTRASLSEDRKLWRNFFEGEESFQDIMNSIEKVAQEEARKSGKIVMTKVVGGFVAVK